MRFSALPALLMGFVAGCSDPDSNEPGATGGGSAGSGAVSTGGVGASGGGGAGGSSAGQGGSGAGMSACEGLPGPTMVALEAPNGTAFCIDRTEVTQGQYKEFLTQVKTPPGSEDEKCSANTSYSPVVFPSSMEGATCIADVTWAPDATPNRPVVCVDWCDAAAYCEWAGKRLCGRVGGGELTVTGKLNAPDEPAADANQSEWYNACSQGGETVFPYGDVYDPLACEGIDVASDGNGGLLPKKDVGARLGCKGGKEPFATVRDLSGSVFEMTNELLLWNGVWTHALRGGARTSSAEHLSCSFYGTTDIGATDSAYGFRCCKDAS